MLKLLAKKTIAAIVACGVLGMSMPANALTVFDPKNFVKNTITSAQSIKSVAEQVRLYSLELQRYKNELLQATKFSPGSLVLGNVDQDIKDSLQMVNELRSAYGSVQTAKSIMEMEMRDYSMSQFSSFDDYAAYQINNAKKQGKGAVSTFQSGQLQLEKAKAQLGEVQKMAEHIRAPVGIQQSIQATNEHLNIMATQNAQALQILASRQMQESYEKGIDEAKKEAATKVMQESAASKKRERDSYADWLNK